ncbi:MAG: hypothetical protein J0I06_05185 [Planctomycetes bacterium]|nr:hypothetical protein [Planctomycetota bacterium]
MIRVDKPVAPPAVLLTRGVSKAQTHRNDYGAAPADHRRGTRTFDFDKSVYAAAEVKGELLAAQRSKCAFCESLVRHVSYGAVEHYRPKAGYKQRKGDRLKRPGYYWLAYDWDNLFFCCQLCNEQFKQNHFPLRDGRRRARCHADSIGDEEPLLIHPARLDISNHIEFRQERAVGRTVEGKATVRVLGLNRPELREARTRRLKSLRALLRVRELLHDQIARASTAKLRAELANIDAQLQASQADTAEYAAMARAFLTP